MPTIWLYRDYLKHSGGHVKMLDYVKHIEASGKYQPKIIFSPTSDLSDNYLKPFLKFRAKKFDPKPHDAILIGGKDWIYWTKYPNIEQHRVINLIQGIRHTNKSLPHYSFLKRKAIRICVSDEIKSALLKTGEVENEVHVINNGIKLPKRPIIKGVKNIHHEKWLLIGYKNQDLANEVNKGLKSLGITADYIKHQVSLNEYEERLKNATVVVHIPFKEEGFYLPALESLALGKLLICPDVVGNRSFCNTHNSIFTLYNLESIMLGIEKALSLEASRIQEIRLNGAETAQGFGLEKEHKAFIEILDNIGSLWNNLA